MVLHRINIHDKAWTVYSCPVTLMYMGMLVCLPFHSLWPSDAIWLHIWVNIGSGNGLLPDGIKPLPEPMLTIIQGVLWHSPQRNFTEVSVHFKNTSILLPVPHIPEVSV